ncbi:MULTISPECIES: GGDEF domain-containing protein [unclassified Halomonas]|uniref:GGDEF domain-containing protein n=1 Tax=unclassified Halomonas TaxID=2609666 RepID=UPI001EF43D40|nr:MULTISPECIES: GGDEF domain-containing protein [unclassified Halomonas]MCG7576793.1 diguanylate cyclase [Halomonas sp. MMH1-48]MCG7603856.1 diguanylate cyclase [Halomonas sp. MM17-34]MCG7613106.1 diguanylate cyclase [Halomonas sp. MM17-29]MCG7619606.1 diguanylate cyclase [Halomonas sp. DSH1-27]
MTVDLQALYPKLIHLMLDTVFVVDAEHRILFVSDACESLLGYRADELIGTLITRYMHPEDVAMTHASIKRVMNGQPHLDFRNRYLHKSGSVVHILWSARWSEEEQVRIGVARDITPQVQAEEELRFLAHHDPLTKLTNRSLFYDRLASALTTARRYQARLALLFLDVNDFKSINDVHGHAAGDAVLCEIARRLSSCVRDTDTVARMGGDEFTILLTDLHSKEAAMEKAAQLLDELSSNESVSTLCMGMPSCSVGVAVYPEDGQDANTLLRHADVNMYRMKKQRVRAYSGASKR